MKSNKLPVALMCGLILSGVGFAQASVSINSKVVSTSGMKFLQQLDNRTEAFPRALRNQQKSEFDVLSLMVVLNQTANIEDKLGKLVAEQQKTNKLLAQVLALKSK
jgi:hypothetical protein